MIPVMDDTKASSSTPHSLQCSINEFRRLVDIPLTRIFKFKQDRFLRKMDIVLHLKRFVAVSSEKINQLGSVRGRGVRVAYEVVHSVIWVPYHLSEIWNYLLYL